MCDIRKGTLFKASIKQLYLLFTIGLRQRVVAVIDQFTCTSDRENTTYDKIAIFRKFLEPCLPNDLTCGVFCLCSHQQSE